VYAPQSCPEAIPIVNLLPQLVLSQAIRLEAYLQNELLMIDGLHLYEENDAKIWPNVIFQFSIVENEFEVEPAQSYGSDCNSLSKFSHIHLVELSFGLNLLI